MATRSNTTPLPTKRSALPFVKQMDLRDINNAITAIDQQLSVLNGLANEANLKAGQAQVLNSQGAGSLIGIQQQIAALQTALAALNAFSATPTVRADVAIQQYDVVYPTSDGGVSPVDTQDPTAIFAVLGVATTSANPGTELVVRRAGTLVVNSADFEIGRAVYAQVGSGLTQWPNYAAVAIPVGVAITASAMDVRPGAPALMQMPTYAGEYDEFVPVTLMLVRQVLDFVSTVFGQEDGILVKIGGQIVTREIVSPSGSGIDVQNGDGVDGNPSIS